MSLKITASVPRRGLGWNLIAATPRPGSSRASASLPGQLKWIHLPRLLLAGAFRIYPPSGLRETRQQLKFIARGLTMPRLMRDWFQFWQLPQLAPLAGSHPRLLLKLQRPYLRRGLTAGARWEILCQHYAFATERFSAGGLRRIFSPPGVLLARISAPAVGDFGVRLTYHNLFEKEGELSLVFYEEQKQTPLFALSFCVSGNGPDDREFFVGGLQGWKQANAREYIVAITRAMEGLRPKALLLFVLQTLAQHWHIRGLRAVSNETRELRLRKTGINADYDEFWLDAGGQRGVDGNFILPAAFMPRDLAEIKPNKRPMYRRRYAMLEALAAQIHQNVGRLEG